MKTSRFFWMIIWFAINSVMQLSVLYHLFLTKFFSMKPISSLASSQLASSWRTLRFNIQGQNWFSERQACNFNTSFVSFMLKFILAFPAEFVCTLILSIFVFIYWFETATLHPILPLKIIEKFLSHHKTQKSFQKIIWNDITISLFVC